MVADWAFQHTIMAAWSAMFHAKDLTLHTTTESAKTSIAAAGAASRVAASAGENAATTGMTVSAAGTQSTATGIAGMFRSIMELGPILGPVVFGASIIGMMALISSLTKFESGGVIEGGRKIISVNENGTEAVLNARATSLLGKSGVSALNAGAMISPISNITKPAFQPATSTIGGGASAGSGFSGESKPERTIVIDHRNTGYLEELQRDPNYRNHFVHMMRQNRGAIGIKV
jgi:hypothetical protein